MKKKQKGILLTVLALVSLVVITVGVTLAFFNYTKEGSTENSVTTGTITFLYTEVSGIGRGISISDAYPISDTVGKVQVGEGKVFDFKVTSNTPNKTSIPYEVTARKKSDSTLDEAAVKLYLTKVTGDNEEEVLLSKYNELVQTSKVEVSKYTEKTIYTGKVPSNSTNYEQAFRLRMWIDENTDFSANSDGTYPYNGKTFTVTVNVYANAKIVTDEEIALESNANISSLSVGDEVLTKVEGQDYDYEVALPEGTTSTTINIETEDPYATVNVERIDSLAYHSNIKRLSTKKTLELNPGDNYFKMTVTPEKGKSVSYRIKIYVGCEYIVGEIFNFENIGESNFKTACSGNYKLETWGAQGGTANSVYIGGYGGYSTGVVYLNKDEAINVVVGGAGTNGVSTFRDGGYNGGGAGQSWFYGAYFASGGGATHISTKTGSLSDLKDFKEDILIVSGGGGGSWYQTVDQTILQHGGSGGGYIGGSANGTIATGANTITTGGTQLDGGNLGSWNSSVNIISGSFGQGGNRNGTCGSGGGGGFYGGGGANCTAGGGGSGYLKSTLTNKIMYCYNCKEDDGSENPSYKTISTTGENADATNCPNGYSSSPIPKCAKIGNGYARITYLGK